MEELPIKREDAVAFFRFQIISDMLDAEPGFIEVTARSLAKRQFNDVVNKRMVSFSERTIFTYYSNYKKHGFDGLKPKIRCDKGTHPSIDSAVINDILSLKKELPTRSAAKIMIMLILAGKLEENSIHLRTVNRILNQYGYTRESLSKDSRLYIKHEKDRICAMWQSDVMSAFYIPDGNNGNKLCYLIGIIDDHSRRDMHSEFYFDSTLTRLEDVLRKAVTKHSAPSSLYVDNGKIIISEQFKLLCARLGIKLKHATPAKIIDLKTQKHKSVEAISEVSGYESDISKLYFENIKSNFQKYLDDQLLQSVDKNISGLNSNEAGSIEAHPIRPPKEAEIAIPK